MKHFPALRIFVLSVAPVLFIAGASAQSELIDTDVRPLDMVEEPYDATFTIVERMPQFPGGQEEMFKFIGANIKYPEDAVEAGVEGVVYVTFVVDKDGSIGGARVLRGIGSGCDDEAVRVVMAMPKWEPGMQRGKPVRVQYNMPIRYKLNEPEKKK